MITLILPGASIKNKEWATAVSKNLDLGHEVRPVFWEHWDNPDMPFDPKDKARELVDVVMDESVNIIAKSIGTLIASYIMEAIPDRIQKVVLCGIPLNDLNEENKETIRTALKSYPAENIICFQNEDDPHATFIEVKDFLSKINSEIKIILKPGNDHDYPFFDEFREFLKSS
ncbi:MAG TPA: alpha/beta hydrolase [Patescibacteria group bacterium]|nr:alpha/beta hydrolase [Patescibacteria group bacterium]